MNDIIRIGDEDIIGDFITKIEYKVPLFMCVIGNTETAKVPGISAAGANPEITDYTPAADMEYLIYKKCKCIEGVPITPEGIPTPAIITKASLELSKMPLLIANGGVNVFPSVPYIDFGGKSGKNITYGRAVENPIEIFEKAKIFGKMISKVVNYLVIGESIAGGTTTALGVLTAMGYDALDKISSSLSINPKNKKKQIIDLGLKNTNLKIGDLKGKPFKAIEFFGDPMQPALLGLVIGVGKKIPIILAGGTQMSAILALIKSIECSILKNVIVGTTRWIISDKNSDLRGIINQIDPEIPILAANLDFSMMEYEGLKAYEHGMVKEGVGAGGSVIASVLSSNNEINMKKIQDKIRNNYKELI